MDPLIRPANPDFRWDRVGVHPYKEDQLDAAGNPIFRAITRQTLFSEPVLGCELRYFEMAAGGYSTLERHEHAHAVMIFRGHGKCLLGGDVRTVGPHDLVTIPAWTWHQFRAEADAPLGFLCMVNALRDKPQLPTAAELAAMQANPALAGFLAPLPNPATSS
jgi:quercetin dioxygenase-like cupin family protein